MSINTDDIDGNLFISSVMAHEIGHYLGLFHTTEQSGSNDPLEDTPECNNMSSPQNCPDWDYLMFPFRQDNDTIISDDQGTVMRANPLTK